MTKIIFLLAIITVPLFAAEVKQDRIRNLAASGNAEACFQLGNDYFYGENGRKKNEILASHWYKKAAEKGVAEAMYNYAICLERSAKNKQGEFAAFQWYSKAANQNFDPARYRIASIYAEGITDEKGKVLVRKSPASALEQLEILNSHEYEPGELQLASLLLNASLRPEKRARAFHILSRVCARKEYSPAALRMLADCWYGGIGCRKDVRKAFILLRSASERGDVEATAKLGYFYENGAEGLPRDKKTAYAFYKKAAAKNHPMGMYKYAEWILEQTPDARTAKQALALMRKSASAGCVQAMYQLGMIYRNGTGGEEVNEGISARCFYEAAKLGYAPAQYEFAQCFAEGRGVRQKDDGAAFYWYRRAAMQKHPAAMRCMGICLLEGRGTNRSRTAGLQFLQQASKAGDIKALQLLETMR